MTLMNTYNRLWKVLFVFLAALMLVASTEAASSLPKSKPLVGFEKGRISVRALDVPLEDLLSETEEKSGIAIDLRDSNAAGKRSSVDFQNFLPALAFREILRGLNFAFFYSGTRLARVLILPPGDQTHKARIDYEPKSYWPALSPTENAPLKAEATPRLPRENRKHSDITAKLDVIEAMKDSDDPKGIAALGEAVTDRDPKVKKAALKALAYKKAPNVTQILRRGLSDFDAEFRLEVLEALAAHGDLDSLRQALADPNPEIRETAADLLWNAMARK
jgi:hypothetical protein